MGSAVEALLEATLDSADQLAVLVFLMSNVDRSWSVDEMVLRLRIGPDSIRGVLGEFCAAQLVETSLRQSVSVYRYSPSSRAAAESVAAALDRALKEKREPVVQLIYNRPMDTIRIFADAFRLKRKEE